MKELILYKNLYKKFNKSILKNRNSTVMDFFSSSFGGIWKMEEIKRFWKKHIGEIHKKKSQHKISFYLHIPFCQSRCEYCRHYLQTLDNNIEIDHYLELLIAKMNYFQDVFENIKFKTLYIGGGTPSILSEFQLKFLCRNLFKNFAFEKNGEKTFECNPVNTSLRKLRILKKYDFNRVSFGIQSTNKKILKTMNRSYQDFNLIKKVINDAKKCKFSRINIDLMIGLYGDSPRTVIKSFCDIFSLRPDSVALYPLQPFGEYLSKYYQGNKNYFNKEIRNKLKDFFDLIKPIALKYNYLFFQSCPRTLFSATDEWNFISQEYAANQKKQFDYKYDDTKKIDCFGLGLGSSSYIFNKINYQEVNDNLYTGIKFSQFKQKKLYYIFTLLDANRPIFLNAYKKLFRSDLLKDFQKPIDKLKKLNKIKIQNDSLIFMPKGFKQRFIYSLFFFDKKLIKNLIKIYEKS